MLELSNLFRILTHFIPELLVHHAYILPLLLHLHGEEASDFDILDNFTWKIILVLWKLWRQLLNQPLVFLLDHFAELLLDVNATSVANLEALDADLRLTKRQYLNLLEARVDDNSSVHTCRIERQLVRE